MKKRRQATSCCVLLAGPALLEDQACQVTRETQRWSRSMHDKPIVIGLPTYPSTLRMYSDRPLGEMRGGFIAD